MTDSNEPTHIGFGRVQYGKRFGPWLEIGLGRLDASGVFHSMPNRVPVGGPFNGYTCYVPIGQGPPPDEPGRPAQSSDADEG